MNVYGSLAGPDGVKETSVRVSSEKTGTRIREVIKVRFREK